MDAKVSYISGPISLYVVETRGKIFYLFGDYHGSEQNICDAKGTQMDDALITFKEENKYGESMMIDALIHTMLLYNNDHGISTEFHIEQAIHGSGSYSNFRRDQSGYMIRAINMVHSSIKFPKASPYFPNCKVVPTDIRQQFKGRQMYMSNMAHIMDFAQEKNNYAKLKDLVLTVGVLIDNIDNITDYTLFATGYDKVKRVIDALRKSNFEYAWKLADNFERAENYIVNERQINYKSTGNKTVMMHDVAWNIHNLKLKNRALGDKLLDFIKGLLDDVREESKDLLRNFHAVRIILENNKNNLDILEGVFNDVKSSIIDLMLKMDSLYMDANTLALMLASDSKVFIAYEGNARTQTLFYFLTSIESNIKLSVDNSEDVPFEYTEQPSRCLVVPELSDIIDLAKMRQDIISSGDLDRARTELRSLNKYS